MSFCLYSFSRCFFFFSFIQHFFFLFFLIFCFFISHFEKKACIRVCRNVRQKRKKRKNKIQKIQHKRRHGILLQEQLHHGLDVNRKSCRSKYFPFYLILKYKTIEIQALSLYILFHKILLKSGHYSWMLL